MSQLELNILYGTATLLLATTAARFLMQELISVVLLYKKLRRAVKSGDSSPTQVSPDDP
jgi:hypothetical protein